MGLFLVKVQRIEYYEAKVVVSAKDAGAAWDKANGEVICNGLLDTADYAQTGGTERPGSVSELGSITELADAVVLLDGEAIAGLGETVRATETAVIRSESENGFWNNSLGWVAGATQATAFTEAEKAEFVLPNAARAEARWMPLAEALMAEAETELETP